MHRDAVGKTCSVTDGPCQKCQHLQQQAFFVAAQHTLAACRFTLAVADVYFAATTLFFSNGELGDHFAVIKSALKWQPAACRSSSDKNNVQLAKSRREARIPLLQLQIYHELRCCEEERLCCRCRDDLDAAILPLACATAKLTMSKQRVRLLLQIYA